MFQNISRAYVDPKYKFGLDLVKLDTLVWTLELGTRT